PAFSSSVSLANVSETRRSLGPDAQAAKTNDRRQTQRHVKFTPAS
ncbi:MAG: hypothetical protein ACI85K_001787, partial [Hyphomicrobiaceae bacterium]